MLTDWSPTLSRDKAAEHYNVLGRKLMAASAWTLCLLALTTRLARPVTHGPHANGR